MIDFAAIDSGIMDSEIIDSGVMDADDSHWRE